MPSGSAGFKLAREVALKLPNVKEASSARGVAFTVAGRLLACQAIHASAEPESLMVRIGPDDRARLLVEDPRAFYVTPHYQKHAAVLVRLSKVRRKALSAVFATAWLFVSEKAGTPLSSETRRAPRPKPPTKRYR